MDFKTWWNKNSGRSVQTSSNLENACRYAYNDALMVNDGRIKELESTVLDIQSELARKKMSLTVACNRVEELEDKLKIATSALKRVDNIAYEIDNKEINDIACTALEQLGKLK